MNFINTIKNDPSLRKIFGKRELKIIEKQLLGIKLRDSERTRLSRDIRKKFEAIAKLSSFSSQFELKKGAVIKEIIEEAKQEILDNVLFRKIQRIVLYGSSVENSRTFRSDIDIAVDFDNIDLKEATRFRRDVMSNIDEKVDIQVYNVLPDKIKKEIDLKGRVLYKK